MTLWHTIENHLRYFCNEGIMWKEDLKKRKELCAETGGRNRKVRKGFLSMAERTFPCNWVWDACSRTACFNGRWAHADTAKSMASRWNKVQRMSCNAYVYETCIFLDPLAVRPIVRSNRHATFRYWKAILVSLLVYDLWPSHLTCTVTLVFKLSTIERRARGNCR